MDDFERALQAQRARSKDASAEISAGASMRATGTVVHQWHRGVTEFVGYDQLVADVEVLGFDRDESRVVFSATPFYAEGGGQIGDTGTVENLTRGFEVRILNTTRHEEGAALHHLGSANATFEKGDRCRLVVDGDRRRRIQRSHTATHLLHAALREVLGPHAKQAGSLVDDAELRFDFSHFEKLSPNEIARVEELANAAVLRDLKVEPREMSLEEANAAGAIGLFEEEYRGKEKVRVLSICDEDTGECISKELCGGTHVSRSGEIGLIKIVSEESIASGVRRIRAITGDAVLRRLRDDEALLARLREATGDDPVAGVERLKAQLKDAAARVEAASAAEAHEHVDRLIEGAESIGNVRLVPGRVDLSAEQLKELADALEEKARPAVVLLVGDARGSGIAVCKRSKDLEAIDAGKLIAAVSGTLGGGGGRGKAFAQGGGPQIDRLDDALEAGAKIARDALE